MINNPKILKKVSKVTFINQPEVHSRHTDGEIQYNFENGRLERPLILLVLRHGPLAQLAEQLTLNE